MWAVGPVTITVIVLNIANTRYFWKEADSRVTIYTRRATKYVAWTIAGAFFAPVISLPAVLATEPAEAKEMAAIIAAGVIVAPIFILLARRYPFIYSKKLCIRKGHGQRLHVQLQGQQVATTMGGTNSGGNKHVIELTDAKNNVLKTLTDVWGTPELSDINDCLSSTAP